MSFSQPGHVLQVAATVALLKGRPLEQVMLQTPSHSKHSIGPVPNTPSVKLPLPTGVQVLRANLRNVTEIYGIITQYKASRPST